MISVATQGGTITNFSPRFTLTGMTGVFPPNVIAGLATVTGTDGPPTVDAIANAPAAGGAAGAAPAAYTVPYNLQTGLTRYAPMQPVPPTKITKKKPTPLFPTSAYTIATTWMARPTMVTTLTLSRTFSVSSRENTAAPASQPTGDMAKFL
ncbi:Cell wall synthesis protein kre9 precursor, partial [Cryomyces antarcticus]